MTDLLSHLRDRDEALKADIEYMPNLEKLLASHNSIERIDALSRTSLTVTVLDLSHNHLARIDETTEVLSQLKSLASLMLQGNDLDQRLGAAELGICHAHFGNQRRDQAVHQRFPGAEQMCVTHRAPHDAAQHITAPVLARQHAVGDQEGDGARVVRDHLVGEPAGLKLVRIGAEQLAHLGVEGREEVRVVVAADPLDNARDALEAHPSIHRRFRQGMQNASFIAIELHEDQIPNFDVTIFIGLRSTI